MTKLTDQQKNCMALMINKAIEELKDDFQVKINQQTKLFEVKLKEKDVEIAELSEKVKRLEEKNANLPPSSSPAVCYSQIAKQLAKPGSELYNASIKVTRSHEILSSKKAKNVVIVGLPNSQKTIVEERKTDDENMVNELIRSLNRRIIIKSTFRLKSKFPLVNNATEPLVVEFENEVARNEMLAAARELSTIEAYKKVYIRPDRTPDEQAEFAKLNKERKEANEDLQRNNNLDQPFRFVIRSGKLLCINVTTTKDIGNRKVHPFVKESVAKQARRGSYQPIL